MTIERAVGKFRREMQDLGLGVTISVPGREPVVITEPREEGMSPATTDKPRQLTFDIGGDHAAPRGASISITGTGTIRSELFMGDDVTIQVVDAAGEIVAAYEGQCVGIQFKTHDATETTEEWVERKHIVTLGANE